jgi:beta-mannanase
VGNATTANSATEYVAAWRRVHDIFVASGATNATWVWCPNVAAVGTASYDNIAAAYPGDAYVDWTCLDGYNGDDPWVSFSDLFGPAYRLIAEAVAPGKPMIIGEVGSTEHGGSKAQWISDMFAALPGRFPAIKGILWFDKVEAGPGGFSDWPLESSTASSVAFAQGVGAASFTTDTFASLPASPVPAPPG